MDASRILKPEPHIVINAAGYSAAAGCTALMLLQTESSVVEQQERPTRAATEEVKRESIIRDMRSSIRCVFPLPHLAVGSFAISLSDRYKLILKWL